MNAEAKLLEKCGAEVLVLATNTMHKLASQMMDGVRIPLIHIADATAKAIKQQKLQSPALIATKFTMEQSFYTDRLLAAGLSPVIPATTQREIIHDTIYNELCMNIIDPKSQNSFVKIAKQLVIEGADSVILGCTEVCMLLNQNNVDVPVFDTTTIHCETVLEYALIDA